MLSINSQKKITKNVLFLQSIRPVKTSTYRETADAIIEQYQTREISNLKTELNLVLKLSSKRPEVSAKKFNDHIDSNQVTVTQRSELDAGLDFERVADTTKRSTLRSTPKENLSTKKFLSQ